MDIQFKNVLATGKIFQIQDGFTPIMLAAKAGHTRAVQLFKRECDQEEPTEDILVSVTV